MSKRSESTHIPTNITRANHRNAVYYATEADTEQLWRDIRATVWTGSSGAVNLTSPSSTGNTTSEAQRLTSTASIPENKRMLDAQATSAEPVITVSRQKPRVPFFWDDQATIVVRPEIEVRISDKIVEEIPELRDQKFTDFTLDKGDTPGLYSSTIILDCEWRGSYFNSVKCVTEINMQSRRDTYSAAVMLQLVVSNLDESSDLSTSALSV